MSLSRSILNRLSQDEPKHALHRALRRFDTEETGSVTKAEFGQAAEVFGLHFSPEQTTELFQLYETDQQGKLNSDAFIEAICNGQQ